MQAALGLEAEIQFPFASQHLSRQSTDRAN